MKFFNSKIGFFEYVLIIILIIIYYYLTFVASTDIPLHAQFIKDYAYGNKPFQVNFLYYLTVYSLSFFSSKSSALLVISVYVLTFITLFKYIIVKKIIQTEISDSNLSLNKIASLTSFFLIFSFCLPSILTFKFNYFYLLNFPPNVWHNSTTIFVMPFVILLFWMSLKQLTEFNSKRLFIITFLIILNVLIKPSFIFVFIIAYPIMLLKNYKFSKLFWINLAPILLALLFISFEYFLIFVNKTNEVNNSKVTIDFFHYIYVWGQAKNIFDLLLIVLTTILSSFLFPIIFLFRNKFLLKEDMIQFVLICVFIGIIISNTFCETGAREFDGNFLWQNYMSVFLLFFVCALQLLKLISKNPTGFKAYKLEIFVFLLHFISTIIYFIKIIYISKTTLTQPYF